MFSPKQRAQGTANTRAKRREMWKSFLHGRKMLAYHERVLTPDESEAALRSGTWSNEQLAALEAAGLEVKK